MTAANVAMPRRAEAAATPFGMLRDPRIWLTVGDCDPTSASKTTSPLSNPAHARPAAIELGPGACSRARRRRAWVDAHLADEHVDHVIR